MVIIVVVNLFIAPLVTAAAGSMDYNFVISDAEMIAFESMNQTEIQDFLQAKGGYIRNYVVDSGDGGIISAPELIFRASRNFLLNPKFLLVLLQKEQGLVEDATPKPTQLDWATGYGCLDNQPCNERWRGFRKQVNSAAEQFRYYYDHIDEYNFRPGKTSYIDGQAVTPKNRVTAALYNYTPHLAGNNLFKTLWTNYFVTTLPDGTLAQVSGEDGVWLIQNGLKRPFKSRLALVSRYNADHVVSVTKSDLDVFTQGVDIEFAAYSLLQGASSHDIYLLTNDQKRHITSMDVFRSLGFNPEEIDVVADERLSQIPDGRPVTLQDSYPTGTLLKDKVSSDLFYVESGRKYPILAPAIATVNYPQLKPQKAAGPDLKKYSTGLPVKFRDGTLVKAAGPEVYVISNEKKRYITSEKVFNTIGYKWKNIVQTTDVVLDLHEMGDPLTLE